jgi:hypothetical protein
MRSLSCLAAAFLGLSGSAALAGPNGYTLTTSQVVHLVDLANNSDSVYANTFVPSDSLAAHPSGLLYQADAAGGIYFVPGPPVPMFTVAYTQIADLDYDAGGLWGFSNASQELFYIDLGSATVTYSVPITSGLTGYTITGVTRNPFNGDLFLSGNTGFNQDFLFQVNTNTAAATVVGGLSHGDTASYISDIEFDGTGMLYAVTWFHRWFYSVDPSTAATTFVSSGPHRDVTAMALSNVPEAGTWAGGASACAAALYVFWMRRRNG